MNYSEFKATHVTRAYIRSREVALIQNEEILEVTTYKSWVKLSYFLKFFTKPYLAIEVEVINRY